ncbi:MAG: hypothetical protein JNL09_01040 [Anaerolineales bacterium]|nr:hypothetical protein [Anaerolineales bacterium]
MTGKRIAVFAISAVFGLAITAGIIFLKIPLPFPIPLLNIQNIGFGTTLYKFAYSNVLLLFLSTAGIAFIWLDYFLKTNFLKK